MIEHIRVKIDEANQIKQQIMRFCIEHCSSSDQSLLLRIGSAIGNFSNNLRSALNYSTRDIIETKLKPILPVNDYESVTRNTDFPYKSSLSEFDKIKMVIQLKNHHPQIYDLLESCQPYHSGNQWLAQFMEISNKDKHTAINIPLNPNIVDIVGVGSDMKPAKKPILLAGRILVPVEEGYRQYGTPFYYPPYRAFVNNEGEWIIYLTSLKDNTSINIIWFTENAFARVNALIEDLERLK